MSEDFEWPEDVPGCGRSSERSDNLPEPCAGGGRMSEYENLRARLHKRAQQYTCTTRDLLREAGLAIAALEERVALERRRAVRLAAGHEEAA